MESFHSRVRRLWNDWDIRVLVLASLFLQIILICSGSLRKRNASRCVSFILWLAYLLADWVATFALGILSHSCCGSSSDSHSCNNEIHAFWAPFLLLHLGGPDTITAFSIEDNELWPRRLLELMSQVGLAAYVFIKSMPKTRLIAAALLMFLAGILKYGERSWSLMCASMERLRNTMVTRPDPGPNYAKFMEEYTLRSAAGLRAEIVVEKEPDPQQRSPGTEEKKIISDSEILSKADHFFRTFKRLIVDVILSFHDRNESRSFFLNRDPLQAFKVIEIELSLVYEALYTKAPVIHTTAGLVLRCISFSSILSALLVFIFTKQQHAYKQPDTITTNTLLLGALFLEIYAGCQLVFSDWTVLRLKDRRHVRLSSTIDEVLSLLRPPSKPRWSNSMANYNLISFCLKDKKSIFKWILSFFTVKEAWDRLRNTKRIPVTNELKEFIFQEVENKSRSAYDSKDYKRFSVYRGEFTLKNTGYKKQLGWSVKVELDESILLWHIATDLCYYSDLSKHPDDTHWKSQSQMSKAMSDYMLYLLVVRPFMLTAGIGKIRFGDTCAEAKNFFQQGDAMLNEAQATEMLLSVEIKVPPSEVKGDRSKSVLFDGCRLAKALQELDTKERWKVVSSVWVDMLCYAASHCRGYFHAKQLSAGGELLTFVWFLMAHLGIGEQYKIEAGHARAKLIV